MQYAEFFKRFGASARTKNLRSPDQLTIDAEKADRPVFKLPSSSGLPPEFIRLCPWEMELLFIIARRARVGILEIGRYSGGSTFLLACANAEVPIHSIDIRPQDDERLRQLFATHNVGQNVSLIVGDSTNQPCDSVGQIDLLFVDGDHSYEGCLADIRNWYDAVIPGGVLLFHDSYADTDGQEVQDAIMDFLAESGDGLEVVISPLIGASYWRYARGSMACLRKRRISMLRSGIKRLKRLLREAGLTASQIG